MKTSFLYFVETGAEPRATAPEEVERALRGVCEAGLSWVRVLGSQTPSGGPGLLGWDSRVSWGADRRRVDLEGQRWGEWIREDSPQRAQEGTEKSRVWVGVWRDLAPGPEELRRAGADWRTNRLELGDGRVWEIPVLMLHTGDLALPEALALSSEGGVVRRVVERYAALGRRAVGLWESFWSAPDAEYDRLVAELGEAGVRRWRRESESKPLELAERYRLIGEALGLVYRVGIGEIGVLGLLTTGNLATVGAYLLDLPAYEEAVALLKKNGERGVPTEPGVEVEEPAAVWQ